jgi:PleD family two-component response regulator
MVTAANDMDSLANAFVAGATDYITKPFNRVELLARVRSALKLKAELDRRRAREIELVALTQPSIGSGDISEWIDEATGLFVGEAAEAYLSASASRENGEAISVLALAVDRLDALVSAQGKDAKRNVLTRVAQAVRRITAPIGVNAAAYPDGMIVIVAPHVGLRLAKALAHTLCIAVSELGLANPEAIAADVVTASVGVVSGHAGRGLNRAELVAEARKVVKQAAAAGGNRVVAVDISSNS